jgi:hypothetical protein
MNVIYIYFGFWKDTNLSKIGLEAAALIGAPDSSHVHVFLGFTYYKIMFLRSDASARRGHTPILCFRHLLNNYIARERTASDDVTVRSEYTEKGSKQKVNYV